MTIWNRLNLSLEPGKGVRLAVTRGIMRVRVLAAMAGLLALPLSSGCLVGDVYVPVNRDAGSDVQQADTAVEEVDPNLCWSEEVYCRRNCPAGSRCDFPGVCVPEERPAPDLTTFTDPAQDRDLRTLLTLDGRFAHAIGVIDDLRWGQVVPTFATEAFISETSPFDWFDRPGAFRHMHMADIGGSQDWREGFGARGRGYDANTSYDSVLYMHYLRRGEVPPIVFEVIEAETTTVRFWRAEFVVEPGQDVRRGLNLADESPVQVRPWLDESGQPNLLAEWVFSDADDEFAMPSDARLLSWTRMTWGSIDTSELEREPPARPHEFRMEEATISRGWVVRGQTVRSINRRLPYPTSAYQYLGDPQVDLDDDPDYDMVPIGSITLSAGFPSSEILRADLTPTGECACVRAPDTVEFADDGSQTVTPVWSTTDEPPLNACERAQQVACAPRITRTESAEFLRGYAATCERRPDYVSFVNFVRVVPARSLPARAW
jgi:hypothetical protein